MIVQLQKIGISLGKNVFHGFHGSTVAFTGLPQKQPISRTVTPCKKKGPARKGLERGWRGAGEGLESGWRRAGEGLEKGWRGAGEGLESGWRRAGEARGAG